MSSSSNTKSAGGEFPLVSFDHSQMKGSSHFVVKKINDAKALTFRRLDPWKHRKQSEQNNSFFRNDWEFYSYDLCHACQE